MIYESHFKVRDLSIKMQSGFEGKSLDEEKVLILISSSVRTSYCGVVVMATSPSISRTFSSQQTETPYKLSNNNRGPAPLALNNLYSTFYELSFSKQPMEVGLPSICPHLRCTSAWCFPGSTHGMHQNFLPTVTTMPLHVNNTTSCLTFFINFI